MLLKILVISQYFWPESFRINEVVESLWAVGSEVTVLTGQPNYPEGQIFPGYRAWAMKSQQHDAGFAIFRVPLVPRGTGTAIRLALNYFSFILSAILVAPWVLRGRQFDVVFVYAPSPILQAIPAVWIAWLKRAKLVTWVQDLWPESLSATGFVRHPKILVMVGWLVKWLYRRNDLLLVPSRTFVEPVGRLAGETPVIYHPNPGELVLGRAKEAPGLMLQPGFNVVFAGNLGTVQALHTIVAAAELLRHEPDIRLVVIGSGSRSEWLKGEVFRLGLSNVQLPGRFAPSQMPAILMQASALLVTLAKDPILGQTVPSKLQSYLAMGKPIIAALDGEGARIVAEAEAGVCCPAENSRALASAILGLRDMYPEQRQRMGDSALAYYAQHFEPHALAQQLLQLLVNIVQRK